MFLDSGMKIIAFVPSNVTAHHSPFEQINAVQRIIGKREGVPGLVNRFFHEMAEDLKTGELLMTQLICLGQRLLGSRSSAIHPLLGAKFSFPALDSQRGIVFIET